MTTKKLAITGITGMVGSHLAELLMRDADAEIHGFLRWRSPLDNLAELIKNPEFNSRVTLHYGDLRDSSSVKKFIKDAQPDVIFHLAAQSFPRTSFDAPADTLETNVNGTLHLLEAARDEVPNSIVHVCSSSEVFGRVPADQVPISESTAFHPASPYAISKAGTDMLGRFFFEAYGLDTRVTRMFTHTGPRRGDVFAESTFAKQIAMIEKGILEPIVRVGNLDSTRTIADVRDAVVAYKVLVETPACRGQVYNIGGTETKTVRQILEYLLSISNCPEAEVQVDPARIRPIDADLQIPDTSKFYAHTGWEPDIDWKTTLEDLLDYWRDRISVLGAHLPR